MINSKNLLLSFKKYYWAKRRDIISLVSRNEFLSRSVGFFEVFFYMIKGKSNYGFCSVCEDKTFFIIRSKWLRDNYVCVKCRSIPRVRHLLHIINHHYPSYKDLSIHESSASGPSFEKFRHECKNYVPTYFWPDVETGTSKDGFRCENLESMTFANESFDLVITQDVFEHVMNPDKAFSEVARTLKSGGAHIFTLPMYKTDETFVRAAELDGNVNYFCEKDYHGNPIDSKGALVVREWGYDLPAYIFTHSGLFTTVYLTRDQSLGLDGEFLEVFVSRKL